MSNDTGGCGCNVCKIFFWAKDHGGDYFAAAEALLAHVREVHPNVKNKNVICTLCDRSFEDCPDGTAMQQGAHHFQQYHGTNKDETLGDESDV